MVVPAGHSKQAVVHLLHAKIGSCFHFRRDRGCRLPVRREVACSACRRRTNFLFFSTEKGRDRDSGAGGTAARATLPEPPSSMPPSEALTAAYGPCRAAPGLLEPARACGAGETHPADGKRASSGACMVPVGAGPPLQDGGTAGNPRQLGGRGPEAGPLGRARTPGPASGRTQPERGGVARVPRGHPARDEGESGPDAAPPSEGF